MCQQCQHVGMPLPDTSSRAREVVAWGVFGLTCGAVAMGGYLATAAPGLGWEDDLPAPASC